MIDDQPVVLIVDDREANRYTIAHTLKRSGFQVMEASNGKEALEMANRIPAVILLDVRLPDILGYEVCRRIKSNPNTGFIPIVQLSAAFLDNESKIYALESGADAYLTQPVEPNVLVATIKSLVRLHRAESQSRLSAKQWQATFDGLSEGIALTDSLGVVQRSNRALSKLLDRPYLEIEKHPLNDLLSAHFGMEVDCRKKQQFSEIQYDDRYFDLSLEPIFLDEVHTSSILILSEITARKVAEAAVLANERLAATGRMANTIAHEINNPLEAITNLLYLLKSTSDPDRARDYLDSAQIEVERVSKIARRILSFNRESKAPVPVKLSELLEDVLALNNRGLVDKNLWVIREWDSSLCIEGFPAQLRQVFSNIIRNAIEAALPETRLRLRISGYPRNGSVGGRIARVTISDQGVGIPAPNLRKVFDAFFTTKELRGSGIGLWLSSAIVREHHGYIRVRSSIQPGLSGTCLSVMLPCQWHSDPPPAKD
ncbi:response regulator [Alloacidobacterium dinghuense]|uniref:histidine kinase n=1 Tax=Alloacidobacterium dinghuense TaxID=2763107 RepID=A0A7G8BKW8_9BACT|nr:response regulator [Alloacidobacterium dinghuense]QNI33188.1 response regulator [Alloacidobacterium dinghuense]